MLSVNHDGVWLGIPLQFTAAHPTVCLPDLNSGEQQRFAASRSKLDSAFHQILQGDPTC
ncbi:hypothetical protein ACIQM0_19085 [Streptomyces sp. NPDC091387]|uniref:hypothetical protein n=1 Tax=Streptomyces sp. NPDC091387 TaxID=3365998 RepID=UPI0038104027